MTLFNRLIGFVVFAAYDTDVVIFCEVCDGAALSQNSGTKQRFIPVVERNASVVPGATVDLIAMMPV